MVRPIFFLVFLLSVWVGNSYAQTTAPKYSNEFLQIGTGARGLALGGALVSTVEAPEAGYWNPAVLPSIAPGHHISLMHSEYYGGVAAYDFAAFTTSLDSLSAFSISFIRMGVDDIPDTRLLYDASGVINYDNIRFFSAADIAFLLSYGRKIDDRISVGGTVKVINRKAGDFARAWGFGIDVSALMQLEKGRIGLSLRDATSTFNAWNHSTDLIRSVYEQTGNTLPANSTELTLPSVWFGGSLPLSSSETSAFTLMTDIRFTFDGKRNTLISGNTVSVDPVAGIEWAYKQKLFIRGGLSRFQRPDTSNRFTVEPSGGAGFRAGDLTFHYALNRNNGFEDIHYTHSLSLNWKFSIK